MRFCKRLMTWMNEMNEMKKTEVASIKPESTSTCLRTKITRRTWRTKHDNFHYFRSLQSCLKKGSQMLAAHVALLMHLPMIFHTGVKVQIPLVTKTYLQSCFWSMNFGSDNLLFPAFGIATSPKTSTNMFKLHPCFASTSAGVSASTYRSIYHTNTP